MKEHSGLTVLELISSDERPGAQHGVSSPCLIIGRLCGFQESGEPLVQLEGCSKPVPAASIIPLATEMIDRDVALQFERGDPARPVILGIIQRPSGAISPAKVAEVSAQVDGQRVVFTAEKEIVLRCGQASITLTRAGKVMIRGTYVLSRSSGANRIKGGSVHIN